MSVILHFKDFFKVHSLLAAAFLKAVFMSKPKNPLCD